MFIINVIQIFINFLLIVNFFFKKKIFELSSHDYKLFWNKIIISDFPE